MNPGRFYLPRTGANIVPITRTGYVPTRNGVGIFGRIVSSLRSFNWSGLLNGANKTLNVVNQTIPLVRQAGPMFNNMKSMLRLAKLFGNETRRSNNININIKSDNSNISNNFNDSSTLTEKKEVMNESYPNFFV